MLAFTYILYISWISFFKFEIKSILYYCGICLLKDQDNVGSVLVIFFIFQCTVLCSVSQAESIECKKEMDPFPQLIHLTFTISKQTCQLFWTMWMFQYKYICSVKTDLSDVEMDPFHFCIQLTQPARLVRIWMRLSGLKIFGLVQKSKSCH